VGEFAPVAACARPAGIGISPGRALSMDISLRHFVQLVDAAGGADAGCTWTCWACILPAEMTYQYKGHLAAGRGQPPVWYSKSCELLVAANNMPKRRTD